MKHLALTIFSIFFISLPGSVSAQLDETESSYLLLMREEEKLERDTYLTLYDTWSLKVFSNIAKSEQRHMDAILGMLGLYGLSDPVTSDSVGVFNNDVLAGYYDQLTALGGLSLVDALHVGAFIEELDIADLRDAIEETDEDSLINTYDNLLAGSRNHLRAFVSQITGSGIDYEAQVLEQDDVDAIIGGYDLVPEGGFTINAGLNDAWVYPETPGQGFFITVFEDAQLVSLAWFTFDTEIASDSSEVNLGSAGQRWLTALGSFDGAQAELEIFVTEGGVFDTEEPVPVSTPGGSILLQFENCNSGSVTYDIPAINQVGVVPIQRVALDNVPYCESLIGESAESQ